MDTIIRETLRPFGITRTYCGYSQIVCAIALVIEDESRLCHITTEVYDVVAKQTHCNLTSVERNIRTLIHCAWRNNRTLLLEMAGSPFNSPPSVSQFIDIVASYIIRHSPTAPSHFHLT